MAAKQRERGGGPSPPRSESESHKPPATQPTGVESPQSKLTREDTKVMAQSELQAEAQHRRIQPDGITVIGEAVRRIAPETAEFLIEITTSAPNAAQALRD